MKISDTFTLFWGLLFQIIGTLSNQYYHDVKETTLELNNVFDVMNHVKYGKWPH